MSYNMLLKSILSWTPNKEVCKMYIHGIQYHSYSVKKYNGIQYHFIPLYFKNGIQYH